MAVKEIGEKEVPV